MSKIRYKQRFENLEKAFLKFQHTLTELEKNSKNEIYQLALIQAFEFTYELSWKTLKDYLKYSGIKEVNLPREVFKQAFANALIQDGQVWIEMLEDRNLMAHTYDEKRAEKAIFNITKKYAPAIRDLFLFFKSKL